VSRVDPSAAVSITVPAEKLEVMHDALEKALGEPSEQEDFFTSQNEATRRLSKEVSDTYDAMIDSMMQELVVLFRIKKMLLV